MVRTDGIGGADDIMSKIALTFGTKAVLTQGNKVTLQSGGAPGPKGDPGSSGSGISIPPISFSFGDAPHVVWTSTAIGTILTTRLNLITPFNGSNPSLTLGTTVNHTALLAANDTDLTLIADYEVATELAVIVGTQLWLEITPGAGTTAGAGTIYLTFFPN